jgi:hypothetical protein
MRRDVEYLQRRLGEIQVHVLALLILNGRSAKLGDTFKWVRDLDDVGDTTYDSAVITERLLEYANRRAEVYANCFQINGTYSPGQEGHARIFY